MGPLSPSLGPFTTRGLDLLKLVAACGKLVPVQSSSVDAWVTGSSTNSRLNRYIEKCVDISTPLATLLFFFSTFLAVFYFFLLVPQVAEQAKCDEFNSLREQAIASQSPELAAVLHNLPGSEWEEEEQVPVHLTAGTTRSGCHLLYL